jgi:mannan endo-1,4-beta-mannosidase
VAAAMSFSVLAQIWRADLEPNSDILATRGRAMCATASPERRMPKRKFAAQAAAWLLISVAAHGCASGGTVPRGTELPDGGAEAGAAGSLTAGRKATAGVGGTAPAAGRGGLGGGGTGGSAGAASTSHSTYYVQDGALFDRCGEKVVLRGINHPTLYVDREGEALPEIAKTGANTVRLFWYAKMGIKIGEAETAISTAIAQHMIPILEMHDSTCEWALDDIIPYWTSSEAVALIKRYEKQLIVNIANEPSAPDSSTFRSKYSSVVQTLRKAGIHVPLMIDGSHCGRDYGPLLSQGPALLQADPDHNLIFSAHLYDPLSTSEIGEAMASFVNAKLAFVVGEFANKEPPGCGAPLQYTGIIEQAQKNGVGWLAWSWGDNDPDSAWNSDCDEFDMTSTFAFDSLEGWGKEVAVTNAASIKNTAKRPQSMMTGECR